MALSREAMVSPSAIVMAELTYFFTAMLSKLVPTLTAIAVNI